MAQPKRRWSKQRTHKRRSTWKLEAPKFGTCSHCHAPVMPHKVCPTCGYYNGEEVVVKETNTSANN